MGCTTGRLAVGEGTTRIRMATAALRGSGWMILKKLGQRRGGVRTRWRRGDDTRRGRANTQQCARKKGYDGYEFF